MLQKLSVGPPLVGAAELKPFAEKPVNKDFKGSGSGSSFGKALEDKMTSREPKEAKDTPQKDVREKEKPDKPEAKGKKAETEVAKPEGKKTAGRQQAIQDFMDSFESEFKIPPTRLVEAMAQLDDTQLTQSPEDTAAAVVEQLGLDETETGKAQAMYAALLLQLNQMPAPKAVPEMAIGTGLSQQNAQARIMASQGKQDMMSASVDRLNQKFWATKPETLTTTPPETVAPSLEQVLGQKFNIDESSFDPAQMDGMQEAVPPLNAQAPKLEELPPHLQGQMKETISPALLAALAARQATQGPQGVPGEEAQSEVGLMDEFQQAAQGGKVERPQTGLLPGQNPVQAKMNAEAFQNSSQDQSLMQQNSREFVAKNTSTGNESEATKLTEKNVGFKQSLTGLESLHGAPIKGEGLRAEMAPVGAAPVMAGTASPAEHDAAVKQLMNQAQYLIKKGGGEMKVEMTPEGMGTVHLKVMLQDGKVNMQMSAETAEAKKTIESSLAELKTSLAAHKLSMENVKVDVVNSASTDTATQNQTNLNHGQNQQKETRQFWNQFNENFGSNGRRDSLTEMQGLKGYGGKTRDPLQPIEAASNSRRVEGKGNGLNLVA